MKIQFNALIENSPRTPGIYKMWDTDDTLLYVGKARDISARLRQYVDISKLEPHKQIMRTLVTKVTWETTPTESDALILEEKLIKTERPKYNIMLTDGKMYPMLALTASEFPRLLKFRGKISQKRDVFGPYPSVSALNETIKTIQKVCGLRTCTDTFMHNRTRPCLLYQIGRCSAPCMFKSEVIRAQSEDVNSYELEDKKTSNSELQASALCALRSDNYMKNVRLARKILTGDIAPVIRDLSRDMQSASDKMDFETAATLRDKISALTETSVRGIKKSEISNQQSAISTTPLESWLGFKISRAAVFDNSHIFGRNPVGSMIVFGPDGFIKSDYRHFKLKDAKRAGNDIAMMEEFITRATKSAISNQQSAINLIIVDGGIAQWNIAKKVAPNVPILGVTKGEVRDGDESFILPDGTTIHHSLLSNSQLSTLLRAVRDEAHRFAITFHRTNRAKSATASRLDEIEGIGPARKRAVLHHFGSVRAIADAPLAALLKVPNLGNRAAEKIYGYFH